MVLSKLNQKLGAIAWLSGIAILLLVVGLGLRLALAWLPVPVLIQKSLPDDAFYYFVVARNVIQGNGLSFDGATPANGFHPLWLVSILIPYAIVSDGHLPVNLSLTLSAIADVLAGAVGFYLILRYTRQIQPAVLFLLLYLFNAMVVMEAINGLESAVSVLFFALTSYIYMVHIYQRQPGLGMYLLLGLSAGLMVLARTDNFFLIVAIGLYQLWQGRSCPVRTAGNLTAAAIVGAITLSPWLLWNWVTFGTIVQSSAVAIPYHTRLLMRLNLEAGVPWRDVFMLTYVKTAILSLFYTFRFAGLALVLIPVVLIIRRLKWTGPVDAGAISLGPAAIVLIGAASPIVVHTFVRIFYRTWYFVPLAWAGALFAAIFVAKVLETWPVSNYVKGSIAAALVIVLSLQNFRQHDLYHWQSEMYDAAQWLAAELPAEAVPASFNSGIFGYYGKHQVINLDGVVSWEAIDAFRERRLLAYMESRGVTHLIDYDDYVFNLYYPAFEAGYQKVLVPEETVVDAGPQPAFGGDIVIYTIRRDESARK